MPDLATRIRAAVEQRRTLADAATWPRFADEQGSTWTYDGNPSGAVMAGRWCIGQASAYGDRLDHNRLAAHIAFNDPARIFADCDLAEKILTRHRLRESTVTGWPARCVPCNAPWPCPDVRDLAEAWGVLP